jgi:hypothetical protein
MRRQWSGCIKRQMEFPTKRSQYIVAGIATSGTLAKLLNAFNQVPSRMSTIRNLYINDIQNNVMQYPTIKNNKLGCYTDILEGSMLVLMFAAIQLSIWNIWSPPTSIMSSIPHAAIYDTLAPTTQGDLLLLTVITAYGAIWGLRIVRSAISKLQAIWVESDKSEIKLASPN